MLTGRREKQQKWLNSHLKSFVLSAMLANEERGKACEGSKGEAISYAMLESNIKGKGKDKEGDKK